MGLVQILKDDVSLYNAYVISLYFIIQISDPLNDIVVLSTKMWWKVLNKLSL